MKCDLHIHTYFSDGKYSPEKVVKFAYDVGLSHIAITDHDTVCGVEEGIISGKKLGVEVIPGIEFSSVFEGHDVHILGYFIEYTSKKVKDFLSDLKQKRESRARLMVEKLNDMGYSIDFERVKEIAQDGALGRPHIARALYEKGYTATQEEAFYGLIGNEDPAYVPKYEISVKDAINFLKDSGAVVVLAHPGLLPDRDFALRVLRHEFDGVEVYHPKHSEGDIEFFHDYALKHNLIITGGSDFHWYTSDVRVGVMEFECSKTINALYEKRREGNVKQTR